MRGKNKSKAQFTKKLQEMRQRVAELEAQDAEGKQTGEEWVSLLKSEHEQRLLVETLSEVTLALTSQTEHTAVLDEILRQAQRLVPYKAANIALIEGKMLCIVRAKGYEFADNQAFIANFAAPLASLLTDSQVVRSRVPTIITDTRHDPDWITFEETAWIRSYLALPISLHEQVLGLLRLDSHLPGAFTAADGERLQPLANAAAIALENARLLATSERRTAELEAVRQASLSLTASLEHRAVLESILDSIFKLLPQVRNAHIFLYRNGRFQFGAACWNNAHQNEPFAQPRPHGLIYTTARQGKAIVVPDIKSHPLYTHAPSDWNGAIVGIPLKIDQEVVGVMSVSFRQPHIISESRLRVLELLADQAAIAIENARLYQQAQREIAEREQAEAEREQLIAELEAKNAELERFTYTVSHDLKSPLITIGGFLGYVEQSAIAGNIEQMQADAHQIRGAIEKMHRLLNELLELSRIGRIVNPSQDVPLAELAHETISMMRWQIREQGVQVVISPDLPIVFGDRHRLLEVMQNLIDNAFKFMGDQPVPHVEIGTRQENGEAVCYIQDNGMGIARRYHQKIFGLFEKLSQEGESTGVGLALVKRIVELHGGRIWVESEGVGHGSTFCFILPQAKE